MDDRVVGIALDALPRIAAAAVGCTIPLTIASFAAGLAIAVLVALVRTRPDAATDGMPARLAWRIARLACATYVWVFRGTPLMVQLFVAFFGLPSVGVRLGAMTCAVAVLSLNVGAYASETVRGAIEAVPEGQSDAAASLGMGHWAAMRWVVLPQALSDAVPALSNTFISLVKDTSLVASITVAEMLMVTQRMVAVTYEPLVLYVEVALAYLAICTVLSVAQRRVEAARG